MSTNLALFQQLWTEIQALRKRLGELEHHDGAQLALYLKDGVAAPSAATGIAQIYVDTADGDLKIVFSNGVIKTIVIDT